TSEYPEIPHVTYYEQARGALKDYRLRPAFQAFQTVIRLLPGATFQRRLPTGQGLEILEFALNAECSEIRGQRSEVSNQQSAKILHAVWTTDGHCAGADECYSPELLAQAEIYSRDGQQLKHPPRMFSESTVFLVWATDGRRTPEGGTSNAERRPARNASHSDAGGMQNVESGIRHPASGVRRPIPGFRFARQSGWDFDVVRPETNEGRWSGVYLAEAGGERVDIQALIALLGEVQRTDAGTEKQTSNIQHPTSNSEPKTKNEEQRTKNYAVLRILRAARNFVWSTSAPWNAERQIVIKAFKRRGAFRRLSWPTPWPSLGRRAVGTLAGARAQAGRLDCGKPDKALRSWNGAQELLRRGLATPTPLGCLLPTKDAENATTSARWNRAKWSLGARSADATSYYICEMFGAAWSAREVFNAFSAGATEFQGHSAGAWYEALALFLQKLHTRGVYFRDLSAGNLLARDGSGGELEFALIDTARARFFPGSLRLRLRLCDLMRICHPLYWPGRRIFVEQYLAHNGRRFRWWLKIPFLYYDGKHWLKNRWKRWL
ncbi:MAG: hypothetical protein HYV36_03550, partial [Lentisphaerae bacterium]|nr:hypothetical protein [Lentisphaerota bacterium]